MRSFKFVMPCALLALVGCNDIGAAEQKRLYALMGSTLKDGSSARLQNVTSPASGRFCGEVNAKNSYGGYIGFQEFAADTNKGVFVIVPHPGLSPDYHADALRHALAICPERTTRKQTPFTIHYRDNGRLIVDSTWANNADDARARFLSFATLVRPGNVEIIRIERFQ